MAGNPLNPTATLSPGERIARADPLSVRFSCPFEVRSAPRHNPRGLDSELRAPSTIPTFSDQRPSQARLLVQEFIFAFG
jgi:hypothetical protein